MDKYEKVVDGRKLRRKAEFHLELTDRVVVIVVNIPVT